MLNISRSNRLVSIAIAASVLVASSCSSNLEPSALDADSSSPAGSRDSIASNRVLESQFFQSGARTDLVDTFWPEYHDFQELSNAVDLVFIGSLVGFDSDVYQDGGGLEAELEGLTEEERAAELRIPSSKINFDGIHFKVDKLIKGDLEGSEATVAHPVSFQNSDSVAVPISEPPIDVLQAGAGRLLDGSSGQRYVVFANKLDRDLWAFFGPGSLAEIDAKDRIVESSHPPFVFLRSDNSADGWDLDVDLLEDWIANGPPAAKIPLESQPTAEDAPKKPGPELVQTDG